MTVAAAVAAGVALLLWRPPGRWLTVQRLALPHTTWRPRPVLVVVALAAAAFPLLAAVRGHQLLLGATVLGVGAFAVRQARAERARRRARRRRDDVGAAVALLAAELRAGVLPHRALASLADDFGFLGPAARAAALGGDVAAALRVASTQPGATLLADLAGAWHAAERAGAPLVRVLGRLEAVARDDHEIEREVQSGAAPARATGRLMAVLPLFGLGLGSGMGGDPVAVLLGTLPGALCLALGAALACAGVAWVDRIAAAAEAPG